MKTKLSLLAVLMCLCTSLQAQELGLVQIEVRQEKSNKQISGAEVHISPIAKTFLTDKKGKVTVALPYAFYRFDVEVAGFSPVTESFIVRSDTTIVFSLPGETLILDDVEISANRIDQRIQQEQMSIEKITSEKASRLPVIGGEKDLLKAAVYLPGIQSGSEGSSDILVRGGSSDQNLYLMDNATIYHSNHLYGFLSSFNPLIVSEIDIYKGGFPARFGGKLSSVVDAKTVQASYDHFEGEVSIGLAASSLYLNTPIVKNKLNIILAGRRSYYDTFLYLFADKNNYEAYNFYDLNAKLSWQAGKHHNFYLSGYRDRDLYKEVNNFKETDEYDTLSRKWSNQVYNFGWTADYKHFSSRLTAYQSKFQTSLSNIKITPDEFYDDVFSAYINDYTIKYFMESSLTDAFRLYAGTELSWLDILGAETTYRDELNPKGSRQETLPQHDLFNAAYYGGLRWSKGRWSSDLGLRLATYTGDSLKTSFVEPRFTLNFNPEEYRSIKLSYARMSQPVHLLTNPGLGMPVDLYVPASQNFVPSTSDQVSLGYNAYYKWLGKDFNINIEGYYKRMSNIIEYRDGYSSHTFTSPNTTRSLDLSSVLTKGNGKSYGIEYFLSKTSGDWQGALSYTLSWTKHQFDDLNQGAYFPARHDRRHNLALNASYAINHKWRMNAGWQFMTGQAFTMPLSTYQAPNFTFLNGGIRLYDDVQTVLYKQSPRNAYRMKAFHSLNLAFQRDIKWKKMRGTVEFGLYNVYNRKNPYYYYFENGSINSAEEPSYSDLKTRKRLKSVSIFPIIPSINFNIKF